MSRHGPRQGNRRFAPQELAAGAVVLVALAAVVSDLVSDPARDFWADHAMATAMLSGLVLVLLTALVVQRAIERYESRRWDRAADAAVDSYIGAANRALSAIGNELLRGPEPIASDDDNADSPDLWWQASAEERKARLLDVARSHPEWFAKAGLFAKDPVREASTVAMAAYPVVARSDRLTDFVVRIAAFQASLQDIVRLSQATSFLISLSPPEDEDQIAPEVDRLWNQLERVTQDWEAMQDRYFSMRPSH